LLKAKIFNKKVFEECITIVLVFVAVIELKDENDVVLLDLNF